MEIDFDAITSKVAEGDLLIDDEGKNKRIEQLLKAIANDEFELYYQPQIDISTNQLFGSEALVRWIQKDTKRIVPPAEFIPLAEETGLIIPLGEQIIRKACYQNKIWRKQGYRLAPISVNLSPIQLQDENIVEVIKNILDEVSLDPEYLILEITENTSLHNSDDVFSKLDEIRDFGVRIAVDDFGTGYSSLSYLHKVPIDFLKIDREFIKDLIEDVRCQTIVHFIINMANNLNILIIAEGVENEQQVHYLTSLGCNVIQGFIFSKPIPNNDYKKYLSKWECIDFAYHNS